MKKHLQGAGMNDLTVPEEILLTAIQRLGEEAYGVTIRKKIAEVTGRDIAYGTLYNMLAQLDRKGYVVKSRSAPFPERGGRSRIYYRITPNGFNALLRTRELHRKIWRDLALPAESGSDE